MNGMLQQALKQLPALGNLKKQIPSFDDLKRGLSSVSSDDVKRLMDEPFFDVVCGALSALLSGGDPIGTSTGLVQLCVGLTRASKQYGIPLETVFAIGFQKLAQQTGSSLEDIHKRLMALLP